jgi:hypothetical protein
MISHPGGTVGGVYAEILNYSPWVEPALDPFGNTNIVVGWVMLDTNAGANWAQVGWLEMGYGQRYTFTQLETGGGPPITHVFAARPTGGYTYYTVLWNNPSGRFSFQYRDSGSTQAITLESPTYTFVPDEAQVAGEITTYSSQMPGVQTDTEGFYDAHKYAGAWSNFSPTSVETVNATLKQWSYEFGTDGPYYSGTQLNIWDGACQYAN